MKQALFLGIDISARVTSWGETEEVSEVLLAKQALATSQYSLTVRNDDGAFSPFTMASIARGRSFAGKPLMVTWDGLIVFNGYARDIKPSPGGKTAVILAESVTSNIALQKISGTETGINPAEAAMALLLSYGFEDLMDITSFQRSSGQAREAGATIDYNFGDTSNVSLLDALNQIGDLASISFYERAGLVYAQAFSPYAGNGSGLRFDILPSVVRDRGDWEWAIDSYYNQVTVPYPTNLKLTLDDLASRNKYNNRQVAPRDLGSNSVMAHDEDSARFFGSTFLQDSAFPKAVLQLAGGKEFQSIRPGQRYPITYANLGLSAFPVEVIRVKRKLDSNETEISVVNLAAKA